LQIEKPLAETSTNTTWCRRRCGPRRWWNTRVWCLVDEGELPPPKYRVPTF